MRLILDGRLRARERITGAVGLKALYIELSESRDAEAEPISGSGIPLFAALSKMRINHRGLNEAVAVGLFPGVKRGDLTIPATLVEGFVQRFMMLSEIRLHIPLYLPTLKDTLQRFAFKPDPAPQKGRLAAYPRAEMEAFLVKVASGKLSLDPPESARKMLIARTRDLLTSAKEPMPSEVLLRSLRRHGKIGPSDRDHFFLVTMWQERATFVLIGGSGWWLRSRPYLGRTWPVGAKDCSHHEIVEEAVLEMLRLARAPMTQADIVRALDRKRIRIAASDSIRFLRKLVAKRRDVIAKLAGYGYWDRHRPYPPALDDPKTCPTGIQGRFDRVGLLVTKHLIEVGKPVDRDELTVLLDQHGLLPPNYNGSYLSKALAELPDDIIFLRGHGYWLKRRPWPRADYNPVRRKTAA